MKTALHYHLASRFLTKFLLVGLLALPGRMAVAVSLSTTVVTFDANGGTGTMKRQTFRKGVGQRLRANAFKREGGVFVGWAKSRNGAIAYKNRQMVKDIKAGGGKLTLYARWAKSTYKVRFKPNGGKGTMKVESFQYGKAKALFKNRFTRKGYVFAGWSDRPKGKVKFSDGKKVKNLTKTGYTIYLYAKWARPKYTVRFNANGGRGTMADQTLAVNAVHALNANAFTRTGYTFAGWAKSAGGSVAYGNGANVRDLAKKGATVTLYSVWRANTYKVRFNANGGRGSMADQSFTYNAAQALRTNAFTRDGYTFAGWAKSASGSKVYSNRQSVTNLATANGAVITLYAVWTRNTTPPAPAANGLIVRYYDISSSGYSTWAQSEAAITNYFANRTPTIVTNTLDWGKTLQSGFQQNNTGTYFSNYPGLWLNQVSTNRYHGKYAKQSQDKFAMLFEGFLQTDVAGTYSFAAACDDAIVLYIDGTRIVACTEWRQVPQPVSISLETGIHRITIATYEGGGSAGMWVEWKKPGDSSYSPLPQMVLFQGTPSETSNSTFCIIDLSGGASASSYPVYYLSEPPAGGFNTDEYKTKKLVLRRIPAGSFTMGSPAGEVGRWDGREDSHTVTLTHDVWIGVFEVTQRQWELVMGTKPSYFSNASYYATRPVECVSYNDIRGSSSGSHWPASSAVDASSFMGRLRARASLDDGMVWDLPTEAQWEYACRAGMTTALNSGKNLTNTDSDDNMDEVGRYCNNGGSSYSSSCTDENGTAKVGSYLPNAWGLYDMHGNVWECCLDWWQSSLGTASATDPKGGAPETSRVLRGGSWCHYAWRCRSAYRNSRYPSDGFYDDGFRLAGILLE